MRPFVCFFCLIMLVACEPPAPRWDLKLAHTSEGEVTAGSEEALVNAIRNGCEIRVAWGARRAADPQRTIEHAAEPVWISVRDDQSVEVQLDDFMINLAVLGEPNAAHPRRERFGGSERAVFWRATLKTDGTFDAVWYYAHSGAFVERVPQRHPMRWFAGCADHASLPLFPPLSEPSE